MSTYGLSLDEPNFFELDFLPTLFGIGGTRDRGYTIPVTLERKLGDSNCVLIADAHALASGGRPSLRIDVVPVAKRKQHSKVILLHRKRAIRLLIGSANLTHDGFRFLREMVMSLDFGLEGGLPPSVLADAVEEMIDALGPAATPSVISSLKAAVAASSKWPGESLGEYRSLQVAFGGGTVPLWKKLVAAWPQGEPILEWHVCSPFWSDESVPVSPFEVLAKALGQKGVDLSGASFNIITRGDCPGERAKPRFPFGLVQRLRSSGFPIAKGKIKAVRSDVLGDEKIGSMDGGSRDLHAKYIIFRGPHCAVALVGSANFTCKGLGTTRSANIEAGIILKGSPDEVGCNWEPPIAVAGIVDWETCGNSSLAVPEPKADLPPWPDFISSIQLKVNWDAAQDPDGELRIEVDGIAPRFTVSTAVPGEPQVLASISSGKRERVLLNAGSVRQILVRRCVQVHWNTHSAAFPVNVEEGSKTQMPTILGVKPTEEELLAYFHGKVDEDELLLRLQTRATGNSESEAVRGLPIPPTQELQSYILREFVESLMPMAATLRDAMYSSRALEQALLGEFSPIRLAEQIAEACRSGRRSPTAACFQLIEVLRVVSSLEVSDSVTADRQVMAAHLERSLSSIVRLAAVLLKRADFKKVCCDRKVKRYAETCLSGKARTLWRKLLKTSVTGRARAAIKN